MVRVMQDAFNTIQFDTKARTMYGFDAGAEMMQKRLDFAPVNVAADRVLENGMNQIDVFVAHGGNGECGRSN